MKKSGEIEKYNHSHRILLYDIDSDGKCVPRVKSPDLTSELADEWYMANERAWNRVMGEIIEGKSSPICLYIEYHHMTPEDTASRVGLSVSKVRKHMTMEGFRKLDIPTLEKYAKVFNIPVNGFFQFLEYEGDLKFDSKIYHNGLIQILKVKV